MADRYIEASFIEEKGISVVREMLDRVTSCRRAVEIIDQKNLQKIPNREANLHR